MLGGSLDCLTTTKCPCKVTNVACSNDDCECSDFCLVYYDIYRKIIGGQYCFLTYSPKPDRVKSEILADYELSLVESFFRDLINCRGIDDFIMVPELTQKGQIHFHALLRVKDKIKFTKEIIQGLYWQGNILPLWNKMPTKGLHYLFKVSDFMRDYFDKKYPTFVFTRAIILPDSDSDVSDD